MAGVFANALGTITELSTPYALQYLEPIWTGVYEQLQKLRRSLVSIQPLVEDAEERQLTDRAVRCWLLLLKDAVYDAEDILDEAKTHELLIQRKAELSGRLRSKVRDFFSLDHNQLMFKLQLGKKLTNVNERINDLIDEMHKFSLRAVENSSKLWRSRPQTYSYVHESRDIVGRDEDREKLVQLLTRDFLEEKVAVISIVGMGGLGKTTLAQLVYGDERVKKQFEPCIWVCVSDDFDVAKLAGKIIHTASGEICDHTNMEVLQKDLREVLGEKRYLLVLDDVWNEDFRKWDALRNMLLDGGEGSRILVTTRNEQCSRVMGAQKPYILSGLSEESSWVLFEQKAFATGAPKPPKLVEIGEKIVEKCQGLPLAIEVLGSIMHYKSEESEWQAVLENETRKLQHTENKIIPELWLSYVDLPTHLKKCFAFCAIFPKDYNIEEEELIQYWMAHGFVPSQNGNDIEVEGREIFTELIRRSLFQYHHSSPVSTIGRVCKMHDLIHDLAHFVMKNECFTTLKSSAATEILIRPRHLYLDANENFKQGDCSIIRTVLYCRRDLSVLSKLKLVRVLDLNRAYLDELPASIEHLHHLRYFYISNARIRKLPESICMLVNLQTLILYNCPILSELPKSITYMNSLRHLRFDYCPHIKVLPAGLSRLQNLKTLTRYTVEDDAESNIRQLKLLNLGGKVMLYNLQKVKSADDAREANLGYKQNIDKLILNWKARDFLGDNESCSMENAEDVFEGLKPHNKVKELRVSYYPGKQFPIWMRERQQFQYLHQIELLGCRECEQLPPLETLPCLEYLRISQMDGIKHIVNNRRGNALQTFPSLKNLMLSRMRSLEGWCVEEGREANLPLFPCLVWMDITECPKLTTMPLEILPCLEDLSISDMDGIKHIVNDRRGNSVQLFPVLKKLILSEMRNLERWCVEEGREENVSLFPCLIWMDIRGCPKLTSMPFGILPCLKDLSISQMDGIKHIVNNSRGNVPPSFPALKKLTLSEMRNLKGWCLEEGREANMSLFPCLIRMDIRKCPKFTTMPPIPTLQELYLVLSFCETQISLMSTKRCFFKHLGSLRSLNINSCTEELLLLLEDKEETRSMKSSLENLCIGNCNQLSLTLVLQNLTSLRDLWVDSLEKLVSWPDEMRGLESLNKLTISSCKNFTGASSQGDCSPPFLKSLQVSDCDALRELPMCPKSLQSLIILNCPGIDSLWPDMGHLTALSSLKVSNCPTLMSLSDGMQGLTSLESLCIIDCPGLKSFPKGLQQLLSTLKSLTVQGCPELERLCKPGGDYYSLFSDVSYKRIGVQPEETIQVPHEISTGAKQALKCITTNPFLLSAISICAVACSINFLVNKLDSKKEQEVWYIPPT